MIYYRVEVMVEDPAGRTGPGLDSWIGMFSWRTVVPERSPTLSYPAIAKIGYAHDVSCVPPGFRFWFTEQFFLYMENEFINAIDFLHGVGLRVRILKLDTDAEFLPGEHLVPIDDAQIGIHASACQKAAIEHQRGLDTIPTGW